MARVSSFLLSAFAAVSTASAESLVPANASLNSPPAYLPAVATIVKVPTPWYAPKFVVTRKMRDTLAEYRSLPGLNFKAYSFARPEGQFGGVYLWKDRQAATAWFSPAWFDRVQRERGVAAEVRFFDVLLAIDNTSGGTRDDNDSAAVATLVEIPLPAAVSREQLAQRFAAAKSQYQSIPGLLRKYFIATANGTFGGIYLWKDEASARAWFTAEWRARVEAEYGQPARMEWFDTPILLAGQEANGNWVEGKPQP